MLNQAECPLNPSAPSRGEFYAFMLLSITGILLWPVPRTWLALLGPRTYESSHLPWWSWDVLGDAGPRLLSNTSSWAMATACSCRLLWCTAEPAPCNLPISPRLWPVAAAEGLDMVTTAGLLLALLGVGYKLAAAPLHLYAMDVYEGASASLTAFLGFVPKAAGTIAFMVLLQTAGGESLPAMVVTLIGCLRC